MLMYHIIRRLNLDVAPGTTVALVGPVLLSLYVSLFHNFSMPFHMRF